MVTIICPINGDYSTLITFNIPSAFFFSKYLFGYGHLISPKVYPAALGHTFHTAFEGYNNILG
jgi:hypothetical protein